MAELAIAECKVAMAGVDGDYVIFDSAGQPVASEEAAA